MNSPSTIFFHRSRKPFSVNDIDVNKIIISKEVVYGTKNSLKYFIRYNQTIILKTSLDDWLFERV